MNGHGKRVLRAFSIASWIFIFIIGAFYLMGVEAEDRFNEASLYCEMVEKNQKDDSIGWPDYKGIYFDFCVLGGFSRLEALSQATSHQHQLLSRYF